MAEADLSRIVNLIMENPKLIEEIKNMASQTKSDSANTNEEMEESGKTSEVVGEEDTIIANTYPQKDDRRSRRNSLLSALKPYVSEKRCRAIDSMMSIADILEVVRTK